MSATRSGKAPRSMRTSSRESSPSISAMTGEAYIDAWMEQVACDRCGTALVAGAAYCDRCGQRTRRARRMVRLAVRVEILLILAITAVVIGFSTIFYLQK